jgi:pimeloyl-ACP methyl ester carboxylesterase
MREGANNFKPAFLRWLRRLLLAGVVFYVLVCLAYGIFQRRLIYTPPHFTAEHVDKSAGAAGLERWYNPSGQAIGMRRLAPDQPSAGRVLVVYGNGSWTVGCAHYADEIQSVAPFDVYLVEYPGYADRAGSPSEKNLFDAAEEGLQLLGTNEPVYVVGESLGSGVAAYLAGTHPDKIAGMILLSPYNRLTGVGQYRMPFLPVWFMLVDRFPSEDYLRNYHAPVGIMVDGRDRIVPERFGLSLFNGYAGPKQLWRFPDGRHIAIPQPKSKFWGEVVEFWRTHQKQAGAAPN